MKTKVLFIIIFFLVISINLDAQKLTEVKIQTSAQCEMCKERIESNLVFEKGVKDVKLDMDTKKLYVVYKTNKTDLTTIKKAIAKLGYDADDITGDPVAYKNLPMCCKKPKDRGNTSHE